MKFVQKFMQAGRPKSHFQKLDAEPRPASNPTPLFPGGPPPSYRSSTNADDSTTFSSTESSSGAATAASVRRRNSWANLVDSDENLCRLNLPQYTESLCKRVAAAAAAADSSTILMSTCCSETAATYGHNYRSMEKYNLNGRYAKHFTPFYVLNSAGDPIAISKLELTNFDSLCKLNGSEHLPTNFLKRDRMDELRQWFREPKNKPFIFVLLLLLIACCITVPILFLRNELTEESRNFSWMPPLIFRGQQGNSTFIRMYRNGHQRRIAIIDSTLRDNGKNLVCFVMNMNMSTMPDKYSLEIGAHNAFKRKEQTQGWEEVWNFLPGSYFGNSSTLFDPAIPECDGARWILLNYTEFDQKGQKCSDCYDFCLPELGLERDRLRAETFLNIVRRNCFYLFVPEWRSFAAAYSSEQNQFDFEQFYHGGWNRINNGNDNTNINININSNGNDGKRFSTLQNSIDGIVQPISDQYRNFESKWISLQGIPQQISNPTNEAINQMSNIVSSVQNSPSNTVQSISRNKYYQQQQQLTADAYSGSISSDLNLNTNNGFNNNQNGNGFESRNSDLSIDNGRVKPLLPMPPPSYPVQIKQSSLDHGDFYSEVLQSYQIPSGANNVQQTDVFGNSNNIGQFSFPTKYGGQVNSYNPQLSSGKASEDLPNTMSNQPKNIYDQSAMNASPYVQNMLSNTQNKGAVNQQMMNDQGWITVG
uniref:Uncharacterized protein n=1 Tax=Setaria digitata TaxID=48799 RepID=A0A915PUH1_9BILA